MKEATGEGSMTIITIVIIVALAAAAAMVVSVMMSKAKDKTNSVDNSKATICTNPNSNGNCPTNG